MSNLNTARSLIQADLDHARQVLDLWSQQVSELEHALQQLDAVGTSRDALRVEYRGPNSQALAIEQSATPAVGKRRGRKPKNAEAPTEPKSKKTRSTNAAQHGAKLAERSTARATQVAEVKATKPTNAKVGKSKAAPEPRFKDPNSGKTWSGRGRRPFWIRGDAQQYAIGAKAAHPASDVHRHATNDTAMATD